MFDFPFFFHCRVDDAKSLYDGYCPEKKLEEPSSIFCSCGTDLTSECAVGLDMMTCNKILHRKGNFKNPTKTIRGKGFNAYHS